MEEGDADEDDEGGDARGGGGDGRGTGGAVVTRAGDA